MCWCLICPMSQAPHVFSWLWISRVNISGYNGGIGSMSRYSVSPGAP